MSSKNYFTPDNCIDDWEDFPNRHDQTIMLVAQDNGKTYCLEELETNKYGGFSFGVPQLEAINAKLRDWMLKLKRPVWLKGKCGENY